MMKTCDFSMESETAQLHLSAFITDAELGVLHQLLDAWTTLRTELRAMHEALPARPDTER